MPLSSISDLRITSTLSSSWTHWTRLCRVEVGNRSLSFAKCSSLEDIENSLTNMKSSWCMLLSRSKSWFSNALIVFSNSVIPNPTFLWLFEPLCLCRHRSHKPPPASRVSSEVLLGMCACLIPTLNSHVTLFTISFKVHVIVAIVEGHLPGMS